MRVDDIEEASTRRVIKAQQQHSVSVLPQTDLSQTDFSVCYDKAQNKQSKLLLLFLGFQGDES